MSFLRAAHCWGWSAPCVQRQTPATTKLSYPSSFSSSTASSFCLLQLFPLPLKSVCLYPSTCHPFPFPKLLSTRCIPSVSHPLSYFLTLSHTHSSVFRLLPSLSFSLPPNQSHMLEREAERSEDGQDCVVCRECGTVLEPVVRIHAWKCGTHACICLTVRMHAVTCESDSTYGPDFKRLLSVLTVCTSISPQLWVFYNPSIIPVFLSPSSLHPLNTSLFITSLLPPGGCDYLHILILVAPSKSSAL